jgi:hypothetical protein
MRLHERHSIGLRLTLLILQTGICHASCFLIICKKKSFLVSFEIFQQGEACGSGYSNKKCIFGEIIRPESEIFLKAILA